MDTYNPPTKIARIAEDSTSLRITDIGGERDPSTGLELGHGFAGRKYGGFTLLQLQELQHQTFIYKYMEAGLPVPYHLILPIWKSLSGLKGSRVLQHYPNLLGCSPMYCDYRNSMDPEPRRCRRTDGKKWRCSKDVIPDHKYCERHINRGRLRSRQHQEAAQHATTTTINLGVQSSDTNLSISLPTTTGNSSSSPPNFVIHRGGVHKTETAL